MRKGQIFSFVNHRPEKYEFQCVLNASRFLDKDEKIVALAANSPSEQAGWKINYFLSSAKGNFSSAQDISLRKGMNKYQIPIKEEGLSSGIYDLSLGIFDEAGSLIHRIDQQFFILNTKEYEGFITRVSEAKESEMYSSDMRFRESLPTLEIRLEWINQFMEKQS